MVQAAVAGAVGHDGAPPHGSDDVHVRGARLQFEARTSPSAADGLGEGAHQRRVSRGLEGLLPRVTAHPGFSGQTLHRRLQGVDVEVWRQAETHRGLHNVGEAIRSGLDAPQRGQQLVEGTLTPAVEGGSMLPDRQPPLHRRFRDPTVGAGGVAHGALQAVVHQQTALVAQGHGIPAAGLADDARRGAIALRHVARAFRRGGLLLDSADDDDPCPRGQLCLRRRDDEGRQRPFRIHRSAPVQPIPLDAHRHPSRHGVHVPQQHHFVHVAVGGAGGFPHAHGVARPVDVGVEAHGGHLLHQEGGQFTLLAGEAFDLKHVMQQVYRVHG